MDIRSDYFALFGLPRRHALLAADLDSRRRALQARAHPDRAAGGDAALQRVAMQWSVRINEAYACLRDPIRRAAYLCEINGVPINAEDNTAMPADFLIQQMTWREALDDAGERAEIEALGREVGARRAAGMARVGQAIDDHGDFTAAAAEVRALMFVERFAADVDDRLHAAHG